MFERMFNEYEDKVLYPNTTMCLILKDKNGLKLKFNIVRFEIILIFAFTGIYYILYLLEHKKLAFLCLAFAVVLIFFYCISLNNEKIRKDKTNKGKPNKEKSNESQISPRFKNTIFVLTDFGIDVTDTEQLNNLLKEIDHEKTGYWGTFVGIIKFVCVSLIVPVIVETIKMVLKSNSFIKTIDRLGVIIFFCLLFALFGFAIYQILIEIISRRNNNLDRFKRDVEDVLVFKKQASKVLQEMR